MIHVALLLAILIPSLGHASNPAKKLTTLQFKCSEKPLNNSWPVRLSGTLTSDAEVAMKDESVGEYLEAKLVAEFRINLKIALEPENLEQQLREPTFSYSAKREHIDGTVTRWPKLSEVRYYNLIDYSINQPQNLKTNTVRVVGLSINNNSHPDKASEFLELEVYGPDVPMGAFVQVDLTCSVSEK